MADTQNQQATLTHLAASPNPLDPELTRVLQIVSLAQRLHPAEFAFAWATFEKKLRVERGAGESLAGPELRDELVTFSQLVCESILNPKEQVLVESPSLESVDTANRLVENEKMRRLDERAFSERLVKNYIDRLGLQRGAELEKKLTDSLDRTLPDILRQETNPDAVTQRAAQHLARVSGVALPTTPETTLVEAATEAAGGEVSRASGILRTARTAQLVVTLDTPDKSAASAVLLALSREEQNLPGPALVVQSERAGHLAAALSLDPTIAQGVFAQDNLLGFFGRISQTPQERLWAPLADAVIAAVPRRTRETIISVVLEKSFSRSLDVFTRRFGETAAKAVQPLFAQRIQSYQKSTVLSATASRVGKFFGDVFGGIFHAAPDETALAYLELIRFGVVVKPVATTLPQWYFAVDRQRFGGWFSFELLDGLWQWTARTGTKGAVSTSKTGAAAVVASKEVARRTIVGLLGRAGLSGLVGIFTGPVGIFVAQAVLWLGEKLFKPIVAAVGGLASNILQGRVGAIGAVSRALEDYVRSAGFRAPGKKQWYEQEWVLFLALGVFLFFIMSGALSLLLQNTSLAVSAYKVNAPVTEGLPEYFGPLPPASALAGCPVSGGVITQGPNDASGSHKGVDAYDIGGLPEGTPVSATHDGYVVSYRSSFRRGEYKDNSWGNYVVLVGTNESGNRFFTIYAHLWDITGEVVRARSAGALLREGTVLGGLDTTGYTYSAIYGLGKGTHLHYEYRGPGLLQLPKGCAGT